MIREIQRSQPSILFILVSSENSYAEKGYSVYAFDFIPKPIRLARVVGAMERAQGKLNISKLKPLVLQQDDRVERFEWADIIYIKSIVNNIEIHLVNNETITYRATLKSIALQAPEYFIKTTRNALVNITRVKSFTYDAITFIGSSEIIPMSKSAYESVYRAFAKFN